MARGLGASASQPQGATSFLREHSTFPDPREACMVARMLAHIWNRLEEGQPAALVSAKLCLLSDLELPPARRAIGLPCHRCHCELLPAWHAHWLCCWPHVVSEGSE